MVKIGIDTNILVYASGFDDALKQGVCSTLLRRMPAEAVTIPLQVIAEFDRVVSRKLGDKKIAAEFVEIAAANYGVTGMDANILPEALRLTYAHQFQIFDALILAQCAMSGCRLLLSEDMHDGFEWQGCMILNPLTDKSKQKLDSVLSMLG